MISQISFTTPCGTYDFEVTARQLSVLWAFNDVSTKELTLKQIQEFTKLPDMELRQTLRVSSELSFCFWWGIYLVA